VRKRGKSIYTDAQVEGIRRLLGEGKSLREIASLTGIPKTSIYAIARRHNLRPPDSTRRTYDHDKIVELRRSGMSVRAIAESMGCSNGTVSKALQVAGVSSRKKRIRQYSREKRQRIASLYRAGASLPDIAKLEGISTKSARRVILDEGVAIRSRGGGTIRTMEELRVMDRWRLVSSVDDDETWEHRSRGQTCILTDRGQELDDDRFIVLEPDLGGYRSRDAALEAVEAFEDKKT